MITFSQQELSSPRTIILTTQKTEGRVDGKVLEEVEATLVLARPAMIA